MKTAFLSHLRIKVRKSLKKYHDVHIDCQLPISRFLAINSHYHYEYDAKYVFQIGKGRAIPSPLLPPLLQYRRKRARGAKAGQAAHEADILAPPPCRMMQEYSERN